MNRRTDLGADEMVMTVPEEGAEWAASTVLGNVLELESKLKLFQTKSKRA